MELTCYKLSEGTLSNLPEYYQILEGIIYLLFSAPVANFGRRQFIRYLVRQYQLLEGSFPYLPSGTVSILEGKIYPNIFWKRTFEMNITLLSSGTVPTFKSNITLHLLEWHQCLDRTT